MFVSGKVCVVKTVWISEEVLDINVLICVLRSSKTMNLCSKCFAGKSFLSIQFSVNDKEHHKMELMILFGVTSVLHLEQQRLLDGKKINCQLF